MQHDGYLFLAGFVAASVIWDVLVACGKDLGKKSSG
jgi:hypothetical protein